MAEIKIEKKKMMWPWVVSILLIAALVIYLLSFYDINKNTKEIQQSTDLITVNENNSSVTAFVSFVQDDNNKMSLDHAYTNEALLKLTAAVNSMANEVSYSVPTDLDKVQEYADKITRNPFENTHADNIRSAADILTNALQNMQMAKYPILNKEVAELRSASVAINPDLLTLDQKAAVKNYFSKAADLLQKMN